MTEPKPDDGRRTLVAVIVALTAASLVFRLLVFRGLEHTSLVFIGIPALLALALAAVHPRTSVGTTFKTTALALLLSGIVLGEAAVCVLMAAPLFFAIAALISWLDRKGARRLAIVVVVPLSLEGVVPRFALPREEVVTVTRIVAGDRRAVRAALESPMTFDRSLPLFFRLGYPVPGTTAGTGLAVGDRRSVEFLHGGHHPGTLVLEVAHAAEDSVAFTAVSDDSYITHWLSWRAAEVHWRESGQGKTEVTWTLKYRRRLDPAWYFKPLERYGVRLAAGYLIETLATPR